MVENTLQICEAAKRSLERELREVEPFDALAALAAVCRAGVRLLMHRDDRGEVLSYVEPLPESSRQALARLRREHRLRSVSHAKGPRASDEP